MRTASEVVLEPGSLDGLVTGLRLSGDLGVLVPDHVGRAGGSELDDLPQRPSDRCLKPLEGICINIVADDEEGRPQEFGLLGNRLDSVHREVAPGLLHIAEDDLAAFENHLGQGTDAGGFPPCLEERPPSLRERNRQRRIRGCGPKKAKGSARHDVGTERRTSPGAIGAGSPLSKELVQLLGEQVGAENTVRVTRLSPPLPQRRCQEDHELKTSKRGLQAIRIEVPSPLTRSEPSLEDLLK